MRQVVGVARNANYTNWGEAVQPCVYVPLEQNYSDAMTLYIRSKGDPANVIRPVEEAMHAAAPHILISGSRTGRQILDGGLFGARVGVALLTVFGLLALGLASVGLYGLLAYSVNQRRSEIAMRMALGAARSNVERLILRQGMSLVLKGVVIGFVTALLMGRLLSRVLYGVSGADPISLAGAAVVLLLISFVASYLPARGASRVDPLVALREG
jgi:ABC-type antimicrobial peptide transport system permease subunit